MGVHVGAGSKRDCGTNGTPVSDPVMSTDVLSCLRCGAPGRARKLVSVTADARGEVTVRDGGVQLCDACAALPGRDLSDWYEGYLSRAEVT